MASGCFGLGGEDHFFTNKDQKSNPESPQKQPLITSGDVLPQMALIPKCRTTPFKWVLGSIDSRNPAARARLEKLSTALFWSSLRISTAFVVLLSQMCRSSDSRSTLLTLAPFHPFKRELLRPHL